MVKNSAALLGGTTLPKGTTMPKLALRPLPKKEPEQPSDMESDTTLVILPDPVGYRMLIALPTMAEKTKGGIIIPITTNERDRAAAVVGTVLAQGNLCYKDPRKFGYMDPVTSRPVLDKPWCKVGDVVLFSRYSGQRFKSLDATSGDMVEYRMLNDDEISGVVPPGARVEAL